MALEKFAKILGKDGAGSTHLPTDGKRHSLVSQMGDADKNPNMNYQYEYLEVAPDCLVATDAEGIVNGITPKTTFANKTHTHKPDDVLVDVQRQFATTEQLYNIDLSLRQNADNKTACGVAQTAANKGISDAKNSDTHAATAQGIGEYALQVANAIDEKVDAAMETSVEAVHVANLATADAATAIITSNRAEVKSDAAVKTAGGIDAKVNIAMSDASKAVSTSNLADGKADAAVATANGIDAKASEALVKSGQAVDTSNKATDTANGAVTISNGAKDTADSAVVTSNAADASAKTAVQTSDGAMLVANHAIENSAKATTVATDAKAIATTAEANSVNALAVANGVDAKASQALTNSTAAQKSVADLQRDYNDNLKAVRTELTILDIAAGTAHLAIGGIETQIGFMNGHIGDIEKILDEGVPTKTEFDAFEKKVDAEIDAIDNAIGTQLGPIGARIDKIDAALDAMDNYNMVKLGTLSPAEASAGKGFGLIEVLAGFTGATAVGAFTFSVVTVINHVEHYGDLYVAVNNGVLTDLRWKPDTNMGGTISFAAAKAMIIMPKSDEWGKAINYTTGIDIYASVVMRCHNDLIPKLKLLNTVVEAGMGGAVEGFTGGFIFGADTNAWSTQNMIPKRFYTDLLNFSDYTQNGPTVTVPNLQYYTQMTVCERMFTGKNPDTFAHMSYTIKLMRGAGTGYVAHTLMLPYSSSTQCGALFNINIDFATSKAFFSAGQAALSATSTWKVIFE